MRDDVPSKNRAPRRRTCFFDENKTEPNVTDLPVLRKFLTERGKIVSADRSGVCARHQRVLSRAIKSARQLGLLPYTDR